MKCFGYIKHLKGLEKTVLEWYMPGEIGWGNQKRRVQDVIDELQMDAL
jgi:hypothetical protein